MRLLCLVVLLAGCAPLTPTEMRAQEPQVAFTTAAEPKAVAQCLARSIDEYRPFLDVHFASEVREAAPGAWEVRATSNDWLHALAEVKPDTKGSRVTVWQSPQLTYYMARDLAQPCQ